MIRLVSALVFALTLFAAVDGQYSGTWTSDNGNGGKVQMSVASGHADVTYTYQGQNIKTQAVSAKLDGEKIEVVFESDLEGVKLRTSFRGSVKSKDIEGKYQTVGTADGAQVDSGTWKVSQP